MKLIIYCFLCFNAIELVFSCDQKYFGKDSFVCVCSEKSCDTLGRVDQYVPQQIVVYESNQAKLRFKSRIWRKGEADAVKDTVQVTISPKKWRQKIIGFGGAFTDATGINIKSLPEKLSEQILADYFADTGLDYNMGRVPIAGSDFSVRPYSYDDTPDDYLLSNFTLQYEDHHYKIPLMKQAERFKKGLKYFASSWSPPRWMKDNGDWSGFGKLKTSPNRLFEKIWAKYHIKFLDAYKSHGINFWSISTGNEPSMGSKVNQSINELGFEPEDLRDFIRFEFGPQLKECGYGELQVLTYDDAVRYLDEYGSAVLGDKYASEFISGVAIHWYFNEDNPGILQRFHAKYPEYYLISTEACNGVFKAERVSLGDWERGEKYAQDVIDDLNSWVTGWIDWNMALDMRGGPNWAENYVDSPIIVNSQAKEYYRQPMYYALAHFTKFLGPESVNLEHKLTGNTSNVLVTSFLNHENKIIVIALNKNNETKSLHVKGIPWKQLTVKLSPRSIVTIVAGLF